jgi:type II secretory pathway component GspD/PulD (secretin)
LVKTPNPATPLAAGTASPAVELAKGFTYIINNANFPGGVQAVLQLLDSYGNTKVVANPHVAALDNQKATIKAGNRSPHLQADFRRHRAGAADDRRHDRTSQHRYGVLLHVTPHINAGGPVPRSNVPGEVEQSLREPSTLCEARPSTPARAVDRVRAERAITMIMAALISDTTPETSTKRHPAPVAHPGARGLFRRPGAQERPHGAGLFHQPPAS